MLPGWMPEARSDVDRIDAVPLRTHGHESEPTPSRHLRETVVHAVNRLDCRAERQATPGCDKRAHGNESRHLQLFDGIDRQVGQYYVSRISLEPVYCILDPLQDQRRRYFVDHVVADVGYKTAACRR